MKKWLFLILFFSSCLVSVHAKDYNCNLWQVLDIPMEAADVQGSPFDVRVDMEFIHESGEQMFVPGFYNGGNQWVVRVSLNQVGKWKYESSSVVDDLDRVRGEIQVGLNMNENKHGPLIVSKKNPRFFQYADGTPYFLMGFEFDWLFALDVANKEGIPRSKHMLSLAKEHGFNHIVMNVYAYDADWGEREKMDPKYDFSKPEAFPFGGTNESPDYSKLNVDFFKHLDRVIQHMDQEEIIAHLMIYVWNKHVNWPEPNSKADDMYFDYVVKRYQAYSNIVWDISKEALAYGRDDMNYITERIERLRKYDAHDRLVSVHDYNYCSAYPNKVDFISIQEWMPNLYDRMKEVSKKHKGKPVFNIEHGGYETTTHVVFGGAYSDPEVCLLRNYMCAFAGTYSTYYWQNASWYEVIYEPFTLPEEKQPKFSWYKHFTDLFNTFPFEDFRPYQKPFSPYGLYDGSSTFLFFSPPGMDRMAGNIPELKEKKVLVKWFDPFTGKYHGTLEHDFSENDWAWFVKDQNITAPFAVCVIKVMD